jgi:Basic region leucine zipper
MMDLETVEAALDLLESGDLDRTSPCNQRQMSDAPPWDTSWHQMTTSQTGGSAGVDSGCEGHQKKVGRPRISRPPPVQNTTRGKRTRGPKPKYVFQSNEEAANARRERNRQAALNSYYRKREYIQELQTEISRLERENAALSELHQQIASGAPHSLLEPSEAGIGSWLGSNVKPTERAS